MTKSAIELPQWLVWFLAFPLVVLNGWLAFRVFGYFDSLVTVVALAAILAFLLEFPVRGLEKRGFNRNYAVLCVFLPALLTLTAFGVALAPTLLEQLNEVTNHLPDWLALGMQKLQSLHDWALTRNLPSNLDDWVAQVEKRIPNELDTLPQQILSFAFGAVDSLVDVLLTVVFTFYLLLHGDSLWQGIFQWLPLSSEQSTQVRQSLRQSFQNYFIGQLTLSLVMGLTLTVAFLIFQVPYGLLFGIGIGLMALIPFGDTLSIVLVSLLVGLQDIGLGIRIFVLAFVIDQVVDNAVAPRLLGGLVGLNPVWTLISLLVGAKIGGLLGIVIAVPLAAAVKRISDNFRESVSMTS